MLVGIPTDKAPLKMGSQSKIAKQGNKYQESYRIQQMATSGSQELQKIELLDIHYILSDHIIYTLNIIGVLLINSK